MNTVIELIHEETFSDNNKTIGMLYNHSIDHTIKDSLIYIVSKKNYIFFNTMIDMVDYLYYGDKTDVSRAYMPEDEFDVYLEGVLDGLFSDHLTWLTGE